MLKLLIDKSDAASNQIKKVETTINDKMDKLVEFFPKKSEVDKCFKLQTKYTNKTIQSSINSMVNIMNDSIRPFIDQRALVAFDKGIKDSCKKHVQFYNNESREISYNDKATSYFNQSDKDFQTEDEDVLTIANILSHNDGY